MNESAKGAPPAPASDHTPALSGAWLGLAIVLVARAWVSQHVTLRRPCRDDGAAMDDDPAEEQPAIAGAQRRVAGWLRFQEELLPRVAGER